MKQRYDSYKPSGIDWIGEIPSHWEIAPIKMICRSEKYAIKTGPFGSQLKGEDLKEKGDVRVYNQRNVIDDDFSEVTSFVTIEKAKDLDSFYTLPNDLLITSRGTIGKAAILPTSVEMGILHPCLIALRIDNNKANLSWVQRWINESEAFRTEIASKSNATTIDVIYTETIKNIRLALPPLAEQEAIAEWLDAKCREIDAAIAKVEREIELIDELKQSEISRVVTRGLNPDAPLRPSGIDWIGDVPEHWMTGRIKNKLVIVLGKMLMSAPPKGEEQLYTCEKYLKSRNIGWLELFVDDVEEMWFNKTEKEQYLLKEGDIVVNEGGDIGKVALWKNKNQDISYYIQNSVLKLTPTEGDSRYYVYWIYYLSKSNYFWSIVSQVSIAHLTKEKISNSPMLIIPFSEQREIADYLDWKCAEIDGLKVKLERKRETLVELRQSLISEVVTGKRKVV